MGLRTETLYEVEDSHGGVLFAVSPDEEGLYWYETIEEAEEALPEVYTVINITELALLKLRGWA